MRRDSFGYGDAMRASVRFVLATAILTALWAVCTTVASASPSTAERQICGLLPGDGAYSYFKTKNVSCKVARKVARKAGNKFCSQPANCDESPLGGVDKGKVKAKGWKCRMKVGYEFFQAKCKRKKMKFKAESAA